MTLTLDANLARRLQACATIERRTVEEVIAQALQEYFEQKKIKV